VAPFGTETKLNFGTVLPVSFSGLVTGLVLCILGHSPGRMLATL
jgi:hypothetical protein